MPQTTPERAARWTGMDAEAISYLEGKGYHLNKDWSWTYPDGQSEATEKERDALLYLIQEWDFAGVREKGNG